MKVSVLSGRQLVARCFSGACLFRLLNFVSFLSGACVHGQEVNLGSGAVTTVVGNLTSPTGVCIDTMVKQIFYVHTAESGGTVSCFAYGSTPCVAYVHAVVSCSFVSGCGWGRLFLRALGGLICRKGWVGCRVRCATEIVVHCVGVSLASLSPGRWSSPS